MKVILLATLLLIVAARPTVIIPAPSPAPPGFPHPIICTSVGGGVIVCR